ncbi:MAG: thioredoxin fold domain-containing protein [Ignavibacteriaceae bacterium]|nr:thioredoxin fold domain-containing protein [Ignavibacteriaceae bacterium]
MNKKILVLVWIVLFSNLIFAQFGMQAPKAQIKAFASLDNIQPESEVKIAIKVSIEDEWHINSDKPNEDFLIPSSLMIDTSLGFSLSKIKFPKAHDITLGFSETPLSVYEGDVYIGAILRVPADIQLGEVSLLIEFEFQACDNATCLPPTSVFDTLKLNIVDRSTIINEINQDIFKKIDLSYTPVSNDTVDESSLASTLEESGLLLSLLLVFLGGLALNLTPCVYPLIPITIGFFGGQSEGRTSRLALMGLFYVIGLALTYSAIGVITALSGAVFGALLQNTIVIVIIALIFVLLSLSMFGMYEFSLPNSLVMKAGGAKGGLYGAFFMGLTMGIVAAPCIGPFVLGLVTYVAAKADPVNGFLLFFVLAVGLGTPYFLLAIFSGKIKNLPRAGVWMEAVKHIFGFILLGMAVYFLLPILPKPINSYALPVFMLLSGIIILFIDKEANKLKVFRSIKIVLSILFIGVSAYSLYPTEVKSIEWEYYNQEKYNEALSSNQPIIIDFYADWCIPCKELDALTFSDASVISESKRFFNIKADMTKSTNPEVEKLRNDFKIVGVPTVLIINSEGKEVNRITGFLSAQEFLSIIQQVR